MPSLGEDLLRNIENFATAVGDVTVAAVNSNYTADTTKTISRNNISKQPKFLYVLNITNFITYDKKCAKQLVVRLEPD